MARNVFKSCLQPTLAHLDNIRFLGEKVVVLRLKVLIPLAENAHDNWAKLRIKQGWTLGHQRDDAAKKHPDLVHYNELPESEKQYDRNAAMETLKAIIALGYTIQRKQ